MILYDEETCVVSVSDDSTGHPGYRIAVSEAMALQGSSANKKLFEASVGDDDGFGIDTHFFYIMWDLAKCNSYKTFEEIVDICKSKRKEGVLCYHPNWTGIIYHHTRDAANLIANGFDMQKMREAYNLSFGPGVYCYYKQDDLQYSDDPNLLYAEYVGPFCTCLVSSEDMHEKYGYIPWDYKNIRWKYFKDLSETGRTALKLFEWKETRTLVLNEEQH